MSLVKWTFTGLLVLPAAELVTFLLVAALIGWLWAAALFVATSVAGVLLLRRSGREHLDRFRAAFAQDGIRAVHLESPGVAAVLGGILLVFPGFITDLLGAALLVPAVRRWVRKKLAAARRNRRRRRSDDHVIDLVPGEWHQIPDQRPDRPSRSKEGTTRGSMRGSKARSKTGSKGGTKDA
jgi:UPF0716 protein FxsA